jgi:predicted phage terminase large subunit-like protein
MTAIVDERAEDRTLGLEHAPTFAERFARPEPEPEPARAPVRPTRKPRRKSPAAPKRARERPTVESKSERPRKARRARARAPKSDPDAFDLASVQMPVDISAYSIEEIRIALDRADGLDSLAAFVRLAWHQVEPQALVWSWHLEELCAFLEACIRFEIKNAVVCIPPGLSKSTITMVLAPVWAWLHDARSRWITASHDLALAQRDSQRSKDLILSPWFRARWGDLVQIDAQVEARARQGRADTAGHYYTTAGGRRLATSVGGKGVGWHANYQWVDDPHKELEAYSAVMQAHVDGWWTGTMGGRVSDPKRLSRLVQQQRLAAGDLAGRCRERPEYVSLVLPMEFDPVRACRVPTGGDRRTTKGELLCPARFGPEDVAAMRVRLGDKYEAQAQQDPRPGGTVSIERSWFRRYRALPRSGILVDSWDLKRSGPRASETRGQSFVSGSRWLLVGEDAYLVDEEHGKWGFAETIERMRALARREGPQGIRLAKMLVEDKADGPDAMDELQAEFGGLIELVPPVGDKSSRVRACEARLKGSHVFVPADAAWVEDWLDEVVRFPREPNDRADGMTQVLLWGPGNVGRARGDLRALRALASG